MATKNLPLSRLAGNSTYTQIISQQVCGKVDAYQAAHPGTKLFLMAFGYTSQPLPPTVVKALVDTAHNLGDSKTYTSYEDVVGNPELRQGICTHYYQEKIGVNFDPDEIFISDGAQSATINLQELFSPHAKVAVQDPAYPAFTEGTLLSDRPLIRLPCRESNHFFPDLPQEKVDLIYLCFPHNPTGAVATKEKLQSFVDYAQEHRAIIIFDAVYGPFITDPSLPQSIYDIDGARECAIEVNSFSKWANFTGLRVGWSVVPKNLTMEDTIYGELNQLWKLRHTIKFWGASNIAQQGAIATLSSTGKQQCQQIVEYYQTNAILLRRGLEAIGLTCFGGSHCPYIWVKTPGSLSSWQFFDQLMDRTGIVGIPGIIFGESGEGYLRLSTLGLREEIQESLEKLDQVNSVW